MNTDQMLSLALTQLFQVTIVAFAVAVVTAIVCKRRPHLAHLLWLLVIVKCLTPPVWTSRTGAFGLQSKPQAGAARIDGIAPGGSRLSIIDPAAQASKSSVLSRQVFARGEAQHVEASANEAADSQSFHPSRTGLLVGGWIAGCLMAVLIAIGRSVRLSRLVRSSQTVPLPGADLMFDDLKRSMRIRSRVKLVLTDPALGPALVGWLAPKIIVPRSLAEDTQRLRPILAHEVIHVRRLDHVWATLQLVAQIVWWFHPLVSYANRQLTSARESCCDEETIATLNCEPAGYVQVLVDVLRLRRQMPGGFLAVGIKPMQVTSRRIAHLIGSPSNFHRRTPMGYWLIALLCAAVVLPGAHAAWKGEQAAPATQPAQSIRVEGTLLDFVTNKPIAGATVEGKGITYTLAAGRKELGWTVTATSDPSGKFSLEVPLERVVANSGVEIRITHPDYAQRWGGMPGLWLHEKNVPKPSPVTLKAPVTMSPGEEVSGTVLDPDGKPLADCNVEFRTINSDPENRFLKVEPELSLGSTQTDAAGRFRFNKVKGAQYGSVWAEPTQFSIAELNFNEKRGDIGILQVTRGTRIAGTLVDESNAPVAGTPLILESKGSSSTLSRYSRRETITDAQGHFEFAPVAPGGEYTVTPNDHRFVPSVIKVPATGMATASIDFKPQKMVSIHVRYIPAADDPERTCAFSLDAFSGDQLYVSSMPSDPTGTAAMKVPVGLTNASLHLPGDKDHISQWKFGEDRELHSGTHVPLGRIDHDIDDLIIVGSRAAVLRVNVVSSGDIKNTGTTVEMRYSDPSLWLPPGHGWIEPPGHESANHSDAGILRDTDGRFTISRILPGRAFTVLVRNNDAELISRTMTLKEGEARDLDVKLAPLDQK